MLPFNEGLKSVQAHIASGNVEEAQRILETMEFPSEKACRYWYAQAGIEPSASVLTENVVIVEDQESQLNPTEPAWINAAKPPKRRIPLLDTINALVKSMNHMSSQRNQPGRWM